MRVKIASGMELPLDKAQAFALFYLFNLYYEIGFPDVQIAYKPGLDHQLYERLHAFDNQRDIVIYFMSVLRKIMDYSEVNYNQHTPDPLLKARRYMDSSYMRPELSLKEVAEQSGYNEKYFCTLFKRRFGSSYMSSPRVPSLRCRTTLWTSTPAAAAPWVVTCTTSSPLPAVSSLSSKWKATRRSLKSTKPCRRARTTSPSLPTPLISTPGSTDVKEVPFFKKGTSLTVS